MLFKHLVALSLRSGSHMVAGPGAPPNPEPDRDPELPEPPYPAPREPSPIEPDPRPFPDYRDVPPVTPIDISAD